MRWKRRGRQPRWTLPRLCTQTHYLQSQLCLLRPLGLQVLLSPTPFEAPSSSDAPPPPRSATGTTASRPPLTQAMLLKMGDLAHSAHVCASRLEVAVPRMIERALTIVLTLLRDSIDSLTVRIEVCERGQGATHEVTTLKADITGLRRDVDEQKSTEFTSLFGTVEILNMSSVDIPTCSEVPQATTKDKVRSDDATAKLEAESDEEQLGVTNAAI